MKGLQKISGIFFFLFFLQSTGYCETVTTPVSQNIPEIKDFIKQQKSEQALKLLATQKETFDTLILKAQAYAINNQPLQSLKSYELALKLAENDEVKKRVANFGIAKMNLWLGRKSNAINLYKKLLQSQLDADDKKIAEENLKKAQAKQISLTKKKPVVIENIYKNYDDDMLLAKKAQDNNQPQQAKKYFSNAFYHAKQEASRERAAIFGLGRMELWLENYKEAQKIFTFLLKQNLNRDDYEVALSGYVKSTASLDLPKKAYRKIPKNFHYRSANMILASAQAANWAGWFDKAHCLINRYHSILSAIPMESYLYKEKQRIEDEANRDGSKNKVSPLYYKEGDSSNFSIERIGLNFSHRFSDESLTNVNVTKNIYRQDLQNFHSKSVVLIQKNRFYDDEYNSSFGLGLASFDHWNPLLWTMSLDYQPNDLFSMQVQNSQEIVETIPAIQNKISLNTSSLTFKVYPFYRIQAQQTLYFQHFTDQNERVGGYSLFSYLLSSTLGLKVELTHRYFSSSEPYGGNYFSPGTYQENMAVMKFERKLCNRWRYYLSAGTGYQRVDSIASKAHIYNLGVYGPLFQNVFFNVDYGYSNVAGTSDNGYSRRYASIGIHYVF